MILVGWFMWLVSKLPFPMIHLLSDITFLLVYHGIGYRKKTVRENLIRSFPEKPHEEILAIEKVFFRNFCDLMFETFKTESMTRDEIQERCRLENPEMVQALFQQRKNVTGISSHMCNWEWLSLSLSVNSDYKFLAVYKPLANSRLNEIVIRSREKFGAIFVPIKRLKAILDQSHEKPYFVGLLSDQAPHDYAKAFELPFLGQSTFFVPGPGMLSVKYGLTPVYGWIRRVGRSRYVWRLELLDEAIPAYEELNPFEQEQVKRFSAAHRLELTDAIHALVITRKLARRLEEEIKMAPQDWLWSHRRWKSRH